MREGKMMSRPFPFVACPWIITGTGESIRSLYMVGDDLYCHDASAAGSPKSWKMTASDGRIYLAWEDIIATDWFVRDDLPCVKCE